MKEDIFDGKSLLTSFGNVRIAFNFGIVGDLETFVSKIAFLSIMNRRQIRNLMIDCKLQSLDVSANGLCYHNQCVIDQ